MHSNAIKQNEIESRVAGLRKQAESCLQSHHLERARETWKTAETRSTALRPLLKPVVLSLATAAGNLVGIYISGPQLWAMF